MWTYRPVLEAWIDIGELEDCPSNTIPGFYERLSAWLPSLIEHRCSYDERGGFLRRVEEGTWPGHILEHVTLELQNLAGMPGGFGKAREMDKRGHYKVVVRAWHEDVTRAALHAARDLVMAAIEDRPFDVAATVEMLTDLVDDKCLGPSTAAIVDAADARDIPAIRLSDANLVQLGYGAKSRRIWTAETDRTGAIAESISRDKDLTKSLLLPCGVPVPEGRMVDSPADAWQAAQEIGLPVVIKPYDGNHGRGVFINLTTREEIETAYGVALDEGSGVMIERSVSGAEHRLLVVGGQLVAATKGDMVSVTGDGKSTIQQLIDSQINSDPRRGTTEEHPLNLIRLDSAARLEIARQGFGSGDAVPPAGRTVLIQRTGNHAFDVTDEVHPEVAARAIAAAKMVGIDIAGVDVICENVGRPLESQGGGIVEVNAAPGLRMHLDPSYGKGRDVGAAVIDTMFPAGESGRIPIVAVAGTNGKTTTVRLIAHIVGQSGKRMGMTTTDGVYVQGRRIDTGDCSGPKSAKNVLLHPGVDAAVFETARGGVLREGLGFDRCDVAVVTNIGEGDHLGLNYITTVEELAVVKRVIVQNVGPQGMGVLNAADPNVAKMAAACPGQVTFFAIDPQLPVMMTHRAQGRRTIYREGDALVCSEGAIAERLQLSGIPLTRNGALGFQVENVMAAVGAAWALGIDWNSIRLGLATFVSDAATAPGRFNLFDYQGATLVADYGHNPDAIQALVQAVEALPAGKRWVVISGAGDRRDEDIRRQAEILGAAFDGAILYQDACQRGRADGEVLGLLRQGFAGAARTGEIEEIRGEFLAIDTALAKLSPGDLCLILVDQVEEALAHIGERIRAG